MSVSASPEMTTNGPSRNSSSAFFTLPAVPSGISSVAYRKPHAEILAVTEIVTDERREKRGGDDRVLKPCRLSSRSTCSMIGLLTTGSNGFG